MNNKLILGLCLEKNLFVTNTILSHKRIHVRITYESMRDRSVIDLFLVDKRLPWIQGRNVVLI